MMLTSIPQKNKQSMQLCSRLFLCTALGVFSITAYPQKKDSVALLKTIHVGAIKSKNNFTSTTPVQSLNQATLQQLNAPSAGDAAKYFSGALVKDYGGAGGLKTISVRSLGAASGCIIYDGIPVSDLQTGQIDLSRYSTTFIQSLELQQGSFQQALSPARAYAGASSLSITSNTFSTLNFSQQQWQAGIKAGSFNLWQPSAGLYQPLKKNAVISINAEGLYTTGNYPYFIDNGSFSSKAKRDNADVKSVQGEASLFKLYNDSSTLQVKTGLYSSARGLPGPIIFFNSRSAQRLWNTDFFVQGRYQKKITAATDILLSAKYSNAYTHYNDPDFLNNQGGLDSRYTQGEVYGSVAASHAFNQSFKISLATDIASTVLNADAQHFDHASRISLWENITLQYVQTRWQLHGSILYTAIADKTGSDAQASNNNKFTPALAFSFVPAEGSPLTLRLFYKAIFRMPTFNDLYYNFIGNSLLKPEYAREYNAGITYSKTFTTGLKKLGISADVYYNQVQDKIIAVPNQNLFVWTMRNLGKVSIKGIDINAEARGAITKTTGWFARLAYTWQQALDITDKSSATYKSRIPYTPDHSGSGLLSFSYKKWDAGYSALFSGTHYTLGENNPYNELAGWLTHDVFVSRQLSFKKFITTIKGELNNITDKRFDVVRYYPMPGRSFKISLLFNNL